MDEPHDPYAALRIRDYRCLLSAGVVGTIGAQILTVVVGWDIFERTDSYAALGWAGLAAFVPVLLVSLPAGQAADRHSRRALYQLALVVMASASLGLAAISFWQGPVPLMYLCIALTGCSRALSSPARSSLLPQIVPPHLLANAIAWNTSGWQVANVAGPALGGLVVAVTGANYVAYLLGASCSLVSVLLAAPIRPWTGPAKRGQEPFSATDEKVNTPAPKKAPDPFLPLRSLLVGIRFVYSTKLLLAAITLDLFAVLLGGGTALLPVYARLLQIGPTGFGWLRAAPAVGAFFMAMVLAHRPPLRRPGRALLLAVTGFGLAWIGFGLSRDPILSFVMLALTGALDNISVVVRHTLVQMLTPDSMRGRVSAVNLVFISSSNDLGEFESGMTAAWFGPVLSVVSGGAGTIVVVLLTLARWPELFRLGPLHRVVPDVNVPEPEGLGGLESMPKDGTPAERQA